MDLKNYLDQMGFRYEWSEHTSAHTARSLARKARVPADQVIKPVLVKVDGEFVLCALPANYRVNLNQLRMELGADETTLAGEGDLTCLFADCEPGAEPPVGWLFGLPTLMDESLFEDAKVTFQAGTHRDAVSMSFMDYFRLARPYVGHFGQHV
jgi:Ala-tRNA(Pro) deacylase